jgi:transcriptional regulator with XRE-family HTH domain
MPAIRSQSGAITAAQLRAARAFLGWSARQLASKSGVSHSAIARAEKAKGWVRMHAQKLTAIRGTFEDHGIEFLGSNGVRHIPGDKVPSTDLGT